VAPAAPLRRSRVKRVFGWHNGRTVFLEEKPFLPRRGHQQRAWLPGANSTGQAERFPSARVEQSERELAYPCEPGDHRVHLRRLHSGPAHRYSPDAGCIIKQAKVISPCLQQGMKERNGLAALRIDGGCLASLSKATVRTLERQVVERGGTPMAARNDVVDVERRPVTELREVAVLAPPGVAAEYDVAQRSRDR
jgi:hypothetical protein